MIKIAFFDVDGTLIRLGHPKLSDKMLETLQKLKRNGVLLCMATGRSYTVVPHFEGIDFDIIMSFNGSYTVSGDEVIYNNPINRHDKHQIITNLKHMNRAIAISNREMVVTNGSDPDLKQYFDFGRVEMIIADNFDEICESDIYQIMCSCTKDEYDTILKGTVNASIAAWWDRAVDIIPKDGGKGKAVNAILEYYGIDKSEAIAFGDGHNDIEMLEAVGNGVAMGNANDEVKSHANDVCLSVDEDGIYYYCLDTGLIE